MTHRKIHIIYTFRRDGKKGEKSNIQNDFCAIWSRVLDEQKKAHTKKKNERKSNINILECLKLRLKYKFRRSFFVDVISLKSH